MNTVLIIDMTEKEARECVRQINKHMSNIRALLLDLYERKGWKALGYESWRECASAEFEHDVSYVYRLLNAAQVEQNLNSPIGEIPESHTREIVKLAPIEQQIVYEVAKQTAPDGKMTAAHIKSVVNVFTEVVTTGAIDDGTGIQIKVSEVVDAAITEETHERKERQKAHITGDKPKPVIAEATYTPYGLEFTNAAPVLKSGVKYRVLFYEVSE